MGKHILIIEDDKKLNDGMKLALQTDQERIVSQSRNQLLFQKINSRFIKTQICLTFVSLTHVYYRISYFKTIQGTYREEGSRK